MNWDDLRVFAVVADCKSANRAAQVLLVTPGMITRRLDELEAALEVKLFHRTKSGMVLTAAGEDILDRALSMQRFAESIENSVRSLDRKEEGMVTITAPDGLAAYWIAPRLPQFLNENPKIRVTLNCTPMGEGNAAPDISITPQKAAAQIGDAIHPLATLHYVFAAAASYLEAYGTPQSLASAAGDHRGLRHVAQTHQRENWGPTANAVEALATFSLTSNSSTALVAALLAGAGIATVPTFLCHLHPELKILGPDQAVPIQIWLVNHQDSLSSVRVQKVNDWLHDIFDTKTNPWFRPEFVSPSRFGEELDAIDKRLAPIEPARRRRRANE